MMKTDRDMKGMAVTVKCLLIVHTIIVLHAFKYTIQQSMKKIDIFQVSSKCNNNKKNMYFTREFDVKKNKTLKKLIKQKITNYKHFFNVSTYR